MKHASKSWGIGVGLVVLGAVAPPPSAARAAVIPISSFQVGGFFGPYLPGDAPPPSYPAVPAPDNTPGFQNYFMGRTTVSGFTTSERRAFFIYDMAGIAASIPVGHDVVGVSIDLTLIPGGTSALANFTAGFEHVLFTGTPVPVSGILAPPGTGTPPESVWSTFGMGPFFGDFFIDGPSSPGGGTPPATYTIPLPGAVGAVKGSIGSGTFFVVTARLETYDPGPIGVGAPPAVDPFEYVFGLTDVVSPTGSHAPIPFLTITTGPVPEPSSLAICGLAGFLLLRRYRRRAR